MNGRRIIPTLAAIVVVLLMTACVRYQVTPDQDAVYFDLLYHRQLSEFERSLATDLHLDRPDDRTRLGLLWFSLAQCEELLWPEDGFDEDGYAFLAHSLLSEDLRRRALLMGASPSGGSRYLSVDMMNPEFFQRQPTIRSDDRIIWPARAEEAWVDELPAAIELALDCTPLRTDNAVRQASSLLQRALSGDDKAHAFRDEALFVWARHVASMRGLFDGMDESSTLVMLHNQLEAARALYIRGMERQALLRRAGTQAVPESSPVDPAPFFAEAARLVPDDPRLLGNDEIDALQRSRYALLAGMIALEEERYTEALAWMERADKIAWDEENIWSQRYVRLRLLHERGLLEEMLAIDDGFPPDTHPVFSAYLYRWSNAARRLKKEDRFMGAVMLGLRDRDFRTSAYLMALYREFLILLVEYPFEARTIELLEDLGIRRDTYTRLEELARTALDRGNVEVAGDAARYLLARHADARHHTRYWQILAMAAFLKDDQSGFRDAISKIVARPDGVLEAVPRSRQPAFFATADEEMARTLREILPMMAEWGESPQAQRNRQRWLEQVVDVTQRFLRDAPETAARPALLELYRMASALLQEHPRGYSERVGEVAETPLILGRVFVEQQAPRHEPRIPLRIGPFYSLSLVPRDLPVAQWTDRFAPPVTQEEP